MDRLREAVSYNLRLKAKIIEPPDNLSNEVCRKRFLLIIMARHLAKNLRFKTPGKMFNASQQHKQQPYQFSSI